MLRSLADYRMLIYAVVLIAMMLLNGSQKFDKYKGRMNIGGLFTLLKNKKSAKEAG
jgi:branched-chain amino acid transport system permease protein